MPSESTHSLTEGDNSQPPSMGESTGDMDYPPAFLEPELEDMIESLLPTDSESQDPLIAEAAIPLYDGSQVSRLKTLLALLSIQTKYGWSDASVTELFRYIMMYMILY